MDTLIELYRVVVLALVQGVTEFLPVSSSAHLILFPALLGWEDQGLLQDVVMHFGTLCAVLIYYRRDLSRILTGADEASATAAKLAAASVPVLLCGYWFTEQIETMARSPEWIAYLTIGFAVLLAVAHYRPTRTQTIAWPVALAIGAMQALALMPGVSRMGVVLTAALLLGVARTEAARFAFLLAIPVIAIANFYTLGRASIAEPIVWTPLVVGFVASAAAAFFTIHWFARAIERIGLLPFAAYRVALGVVILLLVV